MKIYSTANPENSLYHHTLDLLGIGITDTTTLPFNQFFRSANIKLRDLAFILWKNSSDWEFDDSNYTDFPIATTDLVASQQDYPLPSTALSIERVEVMDDNGDYVVLKQIDKTDDKVYPHLERYSEEGMPREYDLVGNSLFLFPTPNASDTTLTAGLRLYFSRDIHEFETTDTTEEPGVPKIFHPSIAYGVAYDFSVGKGMSQQAQQNLQYGVMKYEKMLGEFTSRRNKDKKIRVKPRIKSRL
jgi:hypothetical protein